MQDLNRFQWLDLHDGDNNRVSAAPIDNGERHRIVIELETFARAMGIEPGALHYGRREGLIDLAV